MEQKRTSIKSLFTRELIAILIVSGAATGAQALLTPVLPLYMRDVGLSDQNIGLAFSVMMVGIAISEVFWGWAVDRINLKIVLFLGAVAYGIMILVLLLPKTLVPFLVVMVIYGVSRSPLFIVGRWYMGVNAPDDIKAQAFGIMNLTFSVPNIVAGFASGFIAEAWGFRNAILFSATVPLLVGILLLVVSRWLHFKRPEPDQAASENGESRPTSVDGNARLITLYLGAFGVIMFIALGVSMTYLPLFASDVVHLSPSQIGILFGVQGIIQTLLILPLGRMADKVGKRVFIPIGMVIVTLSMFAVLCHGRKHVFPLSFSHPLRKSPCHMDRNRDGDLRPSRGCRMDDRTRGWRLAAELLESRCAVYLWRHRRITGYTALLRREEIYTCHAGSEGEVIFNANISIPPCHCERSEANPGRTFPIRV